jgi:N-acetylglucosamine kinase-like BadF-type ATPase
MVNTQDRYVIGIDGGGTKTEGVLSRLLSGSASGMQHYRGRDCQSLEIVATSHSGPGNLQGYDPQLVFREIENCIESLFQQYPKARDRVQRICFSMAGTSHTQRVNEFKSWVEQRNWSSSFLVTHDARSLIAAGTDEDCGIALIAGTGSFAYGINAQGSEQRCGGWGSLLGDEGSGYWLAVQGLKAAVKAVDGRGPETVLEHSFGDWFRGEPSNQWSLRLASMTRAEIAEGAAVVVRAAELLDPVAQELLNQSANELACHVQVLAESLFREEPFDLALAGGLLVHTKLLQERLAERLECMKVALRRIATVTKPAIGAALLAAKP